MTQSGFEQRQRREAAHVACQGCGSDLLVPGAVERRCEPAQASDDLISLSRDPFQLITAAAAGLAAREITNLIMLCGGCHKHVDAKAFGIEKLAELKAFHAARARRDAVRLEKLLAKAAESLKPTSFEIEVAASRAAARIDAAERRGVHVQQLLAERSHHALYVLNYLLIEATLDKWRQAVHGDLNARNVLLLKREEAPLVLELAGGAARSAWAAAVDLREFYLSPDVSMSDRNEAVSKFASDWLGWSANAPELKREALIDVLLGDDWQRGPDIPVSDFSRVLKQLISKHYQGWRPYDDGQINGMSVTSHSAMTVTEAGESVEMLSLLAGPDISFADEPHVALVKKVLAGLEPLEREVCLTYATCPGRKSWKQAAQLNGLPDSFGEDRVRRMIKARLQGLENAKRPARRAPRH